MADLQEKAGDLLKELMSDPATADKLRDVMAMLGGGGGADSARQSDTSMADTLKNVMGMLGSGVTENHRPSGAPAINMENSIATIQRMKRVYDKVMKADDPRINLLNALRPYLGQKRLGRLDNAMQIVQLTRLTGIMGEFEKM